MIVNLIRLVDGNCLIVNKHFYTEFLSLLSTVTELKLYCVSEVPLTHNQLLLHAVAVVVVVVEG